MGTAIRRVPWNVQPQYAANVRAKYKPLYGLQPGGFGILDTSGVALTAGSGVSRSTKLYKGIDLTDDANGYLRNLAVSASYPLSFVFAGAMPSTASLRCMGSLATAADKCCRVFGNNTGGIQAQHIGGTTNASATSGLVFNFDLPFVTVAVFGSATDVRVYGAGTAGRSSASSSTNIGSLVALTRLAYGHYNGSVALYPLGGDINLAQWLNVALTDSEAWALVDNPWQMYETPPIDIWVPVSAGSGSHATSGDLIGPGSTISGTATQFRAHAASGGLIGSGAAITGTATQFRAHATNGDLIGPGAAITGSAAQSSPGTHATSGDLVGPGAAITGTVTHVGTHDASGALIGAGAAVTGTAAHIIVHATSGDLIGPGAAITGSAAQSSSGSTTLTAADLAAIDALITAQLPNIAAAVLAAYVEGTTTVQQALRLYDAVLGGRVSGAGTSTETFRDLANTKDRVVATVDSSGNRTAVIRDLS